MSFYEEPEDRGANRPSNSASLIDRFSNFIGLGNPQPETPHEQEVNSIAEEPPSRPPHIEIPVSDPSKYTTIPLAENGMTIDEVQQIQDTMQLARQLEAEATLRGQQRLIERTTQAKSSSEKGKAKVDDNQTLDMRVFETDNWKYSVPTQLLNDRITRQTYPVSWAELRATITNVNSYGEFKQALAATLNQIVTLERSKMGFNYQSKGPITHVGTVNARGPTLQELETPAKSKQDPSMAVSPEYSGGVQRNGIFQSPLVETVPHSFDPFEANNIPSTSTMPNIIVPISIATTSPPMSAPFTGPTYTFTLPPPATTGSGIPTPRFNVPFPWTTPRPKIVPPSIPSTSRSPPSFPPRPPPYAPPFPASGIPYYPPPLATAPIDPIAVAAAVGRAMAKQMAPRGGRDVNRVDSR